MVGRSSSARLLLPRLLQERGAFVQPEEGRPPQPGPKCLIVSGRTRLPGVTAHTGPGLADVDAGARRPGRGAVGDGVSGELVPYGRIGKAVACD
jgi:hypothetical protein